MKKKIRRRMIKRQYTGNEKQDIIMDKDKDEKEKDQEEKYIKNSSMTIPPFRP